MKKTNKLDMWIDRSIAQLMKITGEIDLENSREPTSEMSEVPVIHQSPPHAEASDFLSINDWMEAKG